MNLQFEIKAIIQKPIDEVFDAIYNPKKLSAYFTTAGANAPMDEGTTVMWEFADFPGAFSIEVKKCCQTEQKRDLKKLNKFKTFDHFPFDSV